MKKNGKLQIILIVTLLVILLGGGGTIVAMSYLKDAEQPETEEVDPNSFAAWGKQDCFAEVPAMLVEGTKIAKPVDYGSKNYLFIVSGTTVENYQDYLLLLEEYGFTKHVDNGEGLDNGAVLSVTYTKEDLVVTVFHMRNIEKTYISVNPDMKLSKHLKYDDSYLEGNKEGAETTLALLEQFQTGNSLVIQLKNGHFIISDGGREGMLSYLLDYLEGLVPEGETPVIEAWFFTHPHSDHMGVLKELMEEPEQASRIRVNGVYYNMPGENANTKDTGAAKWSSYLKYGMSSLKTQEGKRTQLYRIQTGQRYYFNDITIDIPFTQEQLVPEAYLADINEASTWCMANIEDQRVLFTGDADKGAMKNVMKLYSSEYLSVDVQTSFHHSSNTWDVYTEYAPVETILVTRNALATDNLGIEGNTHLLTKDCEILTYAEGTKVLTFPYARGTAEVLPKLEWKYHTPEEIAARDAQ